MVGAPDENERLDRVLRGDVPETSVERELAAFVDEVRTGFPAPATLPEDRHLAAIVDAASGLSKRGRHVVKMPVLRSAAIKVAAVMALISGSFGGLAIAGALPRTDLRGDLESIVASRLDDQGQDEGVLDDDQGEDGDDLEDVDEQNADEQDEDGLEDDQGEDGDDQGEDGDHQGEDDQGDELQDDQGDDQDENADEQDQDDDQQDGLDSEDGGGNGEDD